MTYDHDEFIEQLENERDSEAIDRRVRDMGNDTVIVACQHIDESGDYSHYGRWSASMRDNCVDRKDGILYGEYQSKEYVYKTHSEKLAIARAIKRATKDGFNLDEDSDSYEEYTVDRYGDHFHVFFDGYKVLARDIWISHSFDNRRDFGYFVPEITPDSAENIKYALQDHKRMEDLCDNDWVMTYVTATVYYKGIEIGHDALGGIESDESEEDYWINEVVQFIDLDDMRAKHIAKLKTQLDTLTA